MNKFYIILAVGFLLIGSGIFLKYKSKQESANITPDKIAYSEAKNNATDYFLSEIGLILVGIGFWGIFFKN